MGARAGSGDFGYLAGRARGIQGVREAAVYRARRHEGFRLGAKFGRDARNPTRALRAFRALWNYVGRNQQRARYFRNILHFGAIFAR